MSDDEITKVEVPAPASSPATTIAPEVAPPPTYDFGGVPMVIMKGGTVSGRQEAEWAKHRADAEQRRRADDAQRGAHVGARHTEHGFEMSQQFNMGKMVNATSPKLVLRYMNRDGSVRQDCESEITQAPNDNDPTKLDTMFALVCPRCVERGTPMGLSQMLVRDSNRKFFIDSRKAGATVVEDAWGVRRQVVIVGTVSCDDLIRCKNTGCDYRVRIHDSQVWVA